MKCGHSPLLLPLPEESFFFGMCVATVKCPKCGSFTFNAPLEESRPTNKWACMDCNYTATAEALLKGLSEEEADSVLPEKLRY